MVSLVAPHQNQTQRLHHESTFHPNPSSIQTWKQKRNPIYNNNHHLQDSSICYKVIKGKREGERERERERERVYMCVCVSVCLCMSLCVCVCVCVSARATHYEQVHMYNCPSLIQKHGHAQERIPVFTKIFQLNQKRVPKDQLHGSLSCQKVYVLLMDNKCKYMSIHLCLSMYTFKCNTVHKCQCSSYT